MRKYGKWILAAAILLLIVALIWFAGRFTIRLPYFLSGTMEKYLLEIPEGENAAALILRNCEETSTQIIGETEYKHYSLDEAAMQSLLPESATMDHVESANSVVYVWYTLPGDVMVLLTYDASGWNHTIVNYEDSGWMFTCTRDAFKLNTPWAQYIS